MDRDCPRRPRGDRAIEALISRTLGWDSESVRACRLPQTDLVVSRLGYACAGLVAWDEAPISSEDVVKVSREIHIACEGGITLFDHADLYAFGKAEAVFGEVLRQSPGLRDKIVIQSKCGQRFPEAGRPGGPIRADLSRAHIANAVEGSLRRLATDRLDILLLHIADTLAEPDEIAQALDDLHKQGKVRYFGVCNYNSGQMEALKRSVQQPIVVNQIQLGLGHVYPLMDGVELAVQAVQAIEGNYGYTRIAGGSTLDYCRLNDITIFAALPLRGILNPPNSARPELTRCAQLLADLARSKMTTPSAIALGWLLQHPAKFLPIIGMPEAEKILANGETEQVTLSRDEWYDLLAAATDLRELFQ